MYLVFFSLSIMSISEVFFKGFVFAFIIPCTFSEIIKGVVLVEHPSTPGF